MRVKESLSGRIEKEFLHSSVVTGAQNSEADQETSKNNNKEKGISEEDSEDQGLKIDDIISADGDHLIFGISQAMKLEVSAP